MTILAILFSFIFGSIGAYLMSRIGHKLALVDGVNERSSHITPTPRGGGVGIWIALIFAGVFGVGLLGFLEDVVTLSPKLRLSIQLVLFAIAVILIWGWHASLYGMLVLLFFVIFMTGTANFYNFMDGINGIAAITGIVGFGLLAYFAYFINMDSKMVLVGMFMLAACLGFLPFNFPRARVFMGDVGSVTLGFIFAAMAIGLSRNFLDFVCLSSFLFPFYTDELTTIYARVKKKENLMIPHRKHIYQILSNEMKIPHWKVSAAYGAMQLAIGVSVLLLRPFGILPVLSALILYFVVAVMLAHAIRDRLEFNC